MHKTYFRILIQYNNSKRTKGCITISLKMYSKSKWKLLLSKIQHGIHAEKKLNTVLSTNWLLCCLTRRLFSRLYLVLPKLNYLHKPSVWWLNFSFPFAKVKGGKWKMFKWKKFHLFSDSFPILQRKDLFCLVKKKKPTQVPTQLLHEYDPGSIHLEEKT